MSHEPIEIYRADSTEQAYLLKEFLDNNGIKASVIDETAKFADVTPGWSSRPRVMVPSEQEGKARQLVREFEQELRHEANRVEDATTADEEQWQEWPLCPQGGQKRQALCSICGTAGTDFPLMDIDRSGGREQVLLFCRTCDDHFQPKFYRRCHACGHDYGDGIRVTGEGPVEREPVSVRVWIVAGSVAAVLIAIVAYFAWVLWH
jgi:hypothetical protein